MLNASDWHGAEKCCSGREKKPHTHARPGRERAKMGEEAEERLATSCRFKTVLRSITSTPVSVIRISGKM